MEMEYDELEECDIGAEIGLSTQESTELKSLFIKYDKDGNGELDIDELSKMINNLRVVAPREDLQAVIDSVDTNDNGTIDCQELLGLVGKTLAEAYSNDDVKDAFNLIDEGGTGNINSLSLSKAMENADVGIAIEDIDFLFSSADESGDGEISFSEFRNIVLNF